MIKQSTIEGLQVYGINPLTMFLTGTVRKMELAERESTKIYRDPFWKDIILDLSPTALKVLMYIIFDLSSGKSYYCFNREQVCKELNIEDYSIILGVVNEELIRYSLLAHTGVKDTYWLNPTIFCY